MEWDERRRADLWKTNEQQAIWNFTSGAAITTQDSWVSEVILKPWESRVWFIFQQDTIISPWQRILHTQTLSTAGSEVNKRKIQKGKFRSWSSLSRNKVRQMFLHAFLMHSRHAEMLRRTPQVNDNSPSDIYLLNKTKCAVKRATEYIYSVPTGTAP